MNAKQKPIKDHNQSINVFKKFQAFAEQNCDLRKDKVKKIVEKIAKNKEKS